MASVTLSVVASRYRDRVRSCVMLDGRIVLGEESKGPGEKLKSLIAEGKRKIGLNMNHIDYIDGAGLGTLVAAPGIAKKEEL